MLKQKSLRRIKRDLYTITYTIVLSFLKTERMSPSTELSLQIELMVKTAEKDPRNIIWALKNWKEITLYAPV